MTVTGVTNCFPTCSYIFTALNNIKVQVTYAMLLICILYGFHARWSFLATSQQIPPESLNTAKFQIMKTTRWIYIAQFLCMESGKYARICKAYIHLSENVIYRNLCTNKESSQTRYGLNSRTCSHLTLGSAGLC